MESRRKLKLSIYCLLTVFLLIWPGDAYGKKRLHKEKEYQEAWCNEAGGITEYVLADRTRVDCLTDEYAIEFDFADKWAEAIGQSLHYAEMSGRKPGIVLILEYPDDERYRERIEQIAAKNKIRVWYLKAYELL